MTCIVAVKGPDKIVIGGDSAGVSGWDITIRKDSKVFTNGPFVMGFTTSFRMGQVLMDMPTPHQKKSHDDFKFMRTSFIDSVHRIFEEKGVMQKKEEVKECGEFIVAYRGEVYKIDADFQVEIQSVPYSACGVGQSYALGALAMMDTNGYSIDEPRKACIRALQIAEQFSGGVRGPFNIIEIPKVIEKPKPEDFE